MRTINEIIVHCSATPEGRDYTIAQIRQWHLQRGFRDIGYHYVIYRDGTIHTGRPVAQAGAHCTGHNAHSIGVCYVGGVAKDNKTPKDTRTEAQKKSLANLHAPMLYLNGGTADAAYPNANGDWGLIADNIPVVKISTLDGHHGTYYEKNAGAYAVAARMWLNWQLKGMISDSALFMNDAYGKAFFPQWTFDRKNW